MIKLSAIDSIVPVAVLIKSCARVRHLCGKNWILKSACEAGTVNCSDR